MRVSFIIPQPSLSEDTFITRQEFSWNQGIPWTPVDGETALHAIASSEAVLNALNVDRETLSRRLATTWTPEAALNDCKL